MWTHPTAGRQQNARRQQRGQLQDALRLAERVGSPVDATDPIVPASPCTVTVGASSSSVWLQLAWLPAVYIVLAAGVTELNE